jgi:hypothetical protein
MPLTSAQHVVVLDRRLHEDETEGDMTRTRPWLQQIGAGVVLGGVAVLGQSADSTMSREVISATGCVARAGADGSEAVLTEGHGAGFVLDGARIAPSVGLVEAARSPSGAPSSNEGTQATRAVEPGTGLPPPDARPRGADLTVRRDDRLLLAPERGVDLAAHVGHRVMVSGRLSSFAAAGGVASASSGRTLTVTRVSMIAPACTTGS